ncbi:MULTISPECIES: aldehyde dehydrogenase family protein [Peribacillus]|uniref:aldehyde dehydrogenase family protein n=1 Tax=Peribacillus TaxID=2675229 RepID=UPI00351E7433
MLQNYAGPGATKQQWNKIQERGRCESYRRWSGKSEGLDGGFYVESAIFADVTNEMTIEQEEIFRPVFV